MAIIYEKNLSTIIEAILSDDFEVNSNNNFDSSLMIKSSRKYIEPSFMEKLVDLTEKLPSYYSKENLDKKSSIERVLNILASFSIYGSFNIIPTDFNIPKTLLDYLNNEILPFFRQHGYYAQDADSLAKSVFTRSFVVNGNNLFDTSNRFNKIQYDTILKVLISSLNCHLEASQIYLGAVINHTSILENCPVKNKELELAVSRATTEVISPYLKTHPDLINDYLDSLIKKDLQLGMDQISKYYSTLYYLINHQYVDASIIDSPNYEKVFIPFFRTCPPSDILNFFQQESVSIDFLHKCFGDEFVFDYFKKGYVDASIMFSPNYEEAFISFFRTCPPSDILKLFQQKSVSIDFLHKCFGDEFVIDYFKRGYIDSSSLIRLVPKDILLNQKNSEKYLKYFSLESLLDYFYINRFNQSILNELKRRKLEIETSFLGENSRVSFEDLLYFTLKGVISKETFDKCTISSKQSITAFFYSDSFSDSDLKVAIQLNLLTPAELVDIYYTIDNITKNSNTDNVKEKLNDKKKKIITKYFSLNQISRFLDDEPALNFYKNAILLSANKDYYKRIAQEESIVKNIIDNNSENTGSSLLTLYLFGIIRARSLQNITLNFNEIKNSNLSQDQLLELYLYNSITSENLRTLNMDIMGLLNNSDQNKSLILKLLVDNLISTSDLTKLIESGKITKSDCETYFSLDKISEFLNNKEVLNFYSTTILSTDKTERLSQEQSILSSIINDSKDSSTYTFNVVILYVNGIIGDASLSNVELDSNLILQMHKDGIISDDVLIRLYKLNKVDELELVNLDEDKLVSSCANGSLSSSLLQVYNVDELLEFLNGKKISAKNILDLYFTNDLTKEDLEKLGVNTSSFIGEHFEDFTIDILSQLLNNGIINHNTLQELCDMEKITSEEFRQIRHNFKIDQALAKLLKLEYIQNEAQAEGTPLGFNPEDATTSTGYQSSFIPSNLIENFFDKLGCTKSIQIVGGALNGYTLYVVPDLEIAFLEVTNKTSYRLRAGNATYILPLIPALEFATKKNKNGLRQESTVRVANHVLSWGKNILEKVSEIYETLNYGTFKYQSYLNAQPQIETLISEIEAEYQKNKGDE